jgi:chaperone modulatory protein CbpM
MTRNDIKPITGAIFDESMEISIVELCEVCSVERKIVDKMIDEGILEPMESGRGSRRLPYSSVRRTRTVIHLQRDLGVNLAGAALALELLDRIDNLRTQLRRK